MDLLLFSELATHEHLITRRHTTSYILGILLLTTLHSCYSIPAAIDNNGDMGLNNDNRVLVTNRSTVITREDSLKMISDIQGDIDHLMLNRIIKKDGIYILAIKREDANFLGIDNTTYDRYLDYVERLNSNSIK